MDLKKKNPRFSLLKKSTEGTRRFGSNSGEVGWIERSEAAELKSTSSASKCGKSSARIETNKQPKSHRTIKKKF